jgi:hypothetical protein
MERKAVGEGYSRYFAPWVALPVLLRLAMLRQWKVVFRCLDPM